MLKYYFVAALVVAALAVPVAARCETKAEMLFSGTGETPARDEFVSNDYDTYFDENGKPRNYSGMDFDLDLKLSDNAHFSAGSFRNSDDGQSYYASVGVETALAPTVAAGVEVGAVAEYGEDERVKPTVIPYLRIGDEDKTNLKLLAAPPVGDLTPGVVGFKLTVPLGP